LFCCPISQQAALNGYQLDKAHKFAATLFDEADRLAKVPEEYVPPEERQYAPAENLLDWLSDARGRDQFVARYGDETEVAWNDAPKQQAEPVYKRSFWTESFVEWGPSGSMLATVHRQGVALWGGKSFGRLMRVGHPGVQQLLFSPCERYLLSFSEFPDNRGSPHVRRCRRRRTVRLPCCGWGPDPTRYLAPQQAYLLTRLPPCPLPLLPRSLCATSGRYAPAAACARLTGRTRSLLWAPLPAPTAG
jgi:hypothetical protein